MPKLLYISLFTMLWFLSCSENLRDRHHQSEVLEKNQGNANELIAADECYFPDWLIEKYPNFQGQVELYHHPQEGYLFLLDFIYVDGSQIWLKKNGQVWREIPWHWQPIPEGLPKGATTKPEPVFHRSCGYLHAPKP